MVVQYNFCFLICFALRNTPYSVRLPHPSLAMARDTFPLRGRLFGGRAAPSVCSADVSPSYGERPLKGRLGYTLHLCRGDLRSFAGERSSPLPDDTKNVSVSQKTAGASPRPTAKLIILCFLLLFGTILSKSLHLEGKVSTRASVASDAVDG